VTRPTLHAVTVGAVVGLAWAAGLRGWMAQLVGEDSSVTWLTVALVLLPGAVVGGLLAWAAVRRAEGLTPIRWLVLSPVLFASALLDPAIFAALLRNGEGGGALMVVTTALLGGVAFSRRRWSFARAAAGVGWVLGMLLLTFIGTMAAPVSTARGAWVCLLGGCLIFLLSLASSLPHPHGTAARDGALPWVGAVVGLAWAGSLRCFMAEVIGAQSTVSWLGTFGYVLAPGAVIGALLGWAELERRRGRPRRVLVWSPLLFVAVLVPGLTDLGAILENGVGGGAVGVPTVVIAGAFALAGRRTVTRVVTGILFAAALAVWVATATSVGGSDFALDTPHGAWATILYSCLLVTGALGTSIPLRAQPQTRAREGSARIAATSAR